MTSKKNVDQVQAGPATPEKALPAANIKFIGRDVWDKGKHKILKAAAPIDRYSNAGELVLLPPADFQKRQRLFYHEQAAAIAAAFPHLYKILRSK